MLILLAILGCKRDADTDPPVPVDLTERLGAGEVRAGVVTDEAALFGGISAEGRAGDLKIYNDRAQFVIQGMREGSYYVQVGGMVIDADTVRPEGMPGRDVVDEWGAMLGFGRLLRPSAIEVVSDGSDGEAVIRVTGTDVGLSLLAGVFENPEFLPDLGLEAVTEYRLGPDSPLLGVTTTVTATTPVPSLGLGDILMGAPEIADAWTSGTGLEASDEPRWIAGYLGMQNDVAVGMIGVDGPLEAGGPANLLTELADTVVGFQAAGPLDAGASRSFTRWYGVGPDLAALSDAALVGEPQRAEGQVTAPDGPVPGARVHVLVDGAPYTVAITGDEGRFAANVPAGSTVTTVADGRGRSMFFGLPDGAGSWPAFAAAPVVESSRASLAVGAPALPFAQGRGMGTGDGLTLGQPARLVVNLEDGLPFTVRVGPSAGGDVDPRLQRGRPDGLAAAGWSRGGPLELLVEPGTWDVLIHRGMRYEVHTATLEFEAGRTEEIDTTLAAAYAHDGWVLGDPHAHASPSGDANISMEDRVLVTAAGGVQLHFGSDHDRVADYRPLVDALGLGGVLRSVVADEVSSVLRGHMNAYPLVPDRSLPNDGAVHWWEDIPATTEDLVAKVRERHGPDIVVQSNHPLDNGIAEAADWTPGVIGDPDFWTDDLDAMEVLNDGAWTDYFPLWLDLTARGHRITPVGVSDSHGHFAATPGMNGTWLQIGDLDDVTDASLVATYRAQRSIAALGVFLELSVAPGSNLTAPTDLVVTARTPSWIQVDRLKLFTNGVETQVVDGTTASFRLDAASDAVFVVTAEGDTPMQPVTNRRPWAATAPYWLDADGGGFTPPLPPLVLE